MSAAKTLNYEDVTQGYNPEAWKKDILHGRIIAIAIGTKDGSEDGSKAFYWTINNLLATSKNIGNKLVLLTGVAEKSSEPDLNVARQLLATHVSRVKTAGIDVDAVPVRALILKGDVRTSVCDAVDELGVDVLVVGTRGLGAVKRVVLGSVSDYLSKNVSCTCIIAK
ncbi:hypothetical protein HK100_010992 [Physocladia obscura]|uniref:UspA domain-containing protein n=1 Tax=Physocladia obscura TaxID=109957 RepID=A0AAD5XGX5_9FUNG|nr:hypothetical protein HK100_010992 [Physocladia obscura]